MKEVEILVEVLDSKDLVLNKLKKFKSKGARTIIDLYFYHPEKENMQVTNKRYPIEWLRLRKMGDKQYLAYKLDHFEGSKWLYSDEHEAEILDIDAMKSILSSLGFKKLLKLKIHKETFLTENYEIDLEDVENLGLFLEVERLNLNDSDDVVKVKKEIPQFIDDMGIKVSKELNFGKPELMLKKKKIKK